MEKSINYGCNNPILVPNFVDTSLFKIDPIIRKDLRKKFNADDNTIIIGYAGSFAIWEGVPILINAFSNLNKKYSNVKLAIMGWMRSPSYCDNIPKLIEDLGLYESVILIPPQPYNKVPAFLSSFDILCCPKIDLEINRLITPIKIIEYMSMGLPTVSSAIGGIPNIIQDNFNGFLVKPGDVNELENKLEWIIINREIAYNIGSKGRDTIIKKYSYNVIESTVREALNNLNFA